MKMKKLLNQLLVWMVVCFAVLLAGCSKNWEGTYKFKSMRYEESGMTVEVEAGEEVMGMLTLTEDFAVLTLNEDGTATMVINFGEEMTQEGTWQKDENGKLALTFDGSTETFECDGKTVSFEMEGAYIVLEK